MDQVLNGMIENFWEKQRELNRQALEEWSNLFNKEDKGGEEIMVDVLLDTVAYDEKPQGATIGAIANRLPQNQTTIAINDLVEAVSNGQSWKASVLTDTNNASFVSSSLVALDIDN